ncbi:BlaI/MecI/CopY family transcriptional regulator [Brevundimonas sp. 3P9-tot-E]|jgi:predicted transcriptional regulator|uniref:BlaI/MecI/CopY family transcriptional regulator n=1 Tax=Brevundimonas TaxID=41275 RepID=UPI000F7823B5|nr:MULTISPECIES: BlaI/MecI/CopY family transcriptional regulator [Brevundimonas]MDA0743095.1 BlaI/MecI/CopY family transcriptional regulator [Pseudomonadota bacterium]MBK1969184.1 BlaI/MecI/CopY family transcriptional regulator [Brevundimonas diminuta]MBK1974487.1 BlaI/MecI/CopY family transcriptional regulator [Brevundimonas diminuta]MDA1320681.1 BlaI/MecI/CopY family transcriptional regulator [Pseudomonadota bacterium]MDM8354499.1 BlaI/MecI/CopY family transcriptional regulator [Brevundimona
MIETLPRREREVFETLCRLGQASTAAVRDALTDPLSDSAVRTLLKRLEAKKLVERTSGSVWRPAPETGALADSALRRMVDTFFAGSAVTAATALLGMAKTLSPEQAAALRRAIDDADDNASGESKA